MEITTMSGKRNDIEIGDLVRKTNSTDWVWKVAEIVTPAGHKPHVRLVRINYPSDERMFAVAAIKDRRLFVEAGELGNRLAARPTLKWEPQAQA
jgi:hypothetical protein